MANRMNTNRDTKVNKRKTGSGEYFDYSLLFITIFMVGFGLVMLYSASSYEAAMEFGDSKYYLISQLKAVVIGVILMVVVIKLDYHIFKKPLIALAAYFGSILMAMMVLTPIGVSANGASRWISLAGFSIQVCEVVKIGVIVFMAFVIEKKAKKLKNIGTFLLCMVFIGISAGVIALITKDLSSSIIVAGIGVVMLFVACPRISYFVIMIGAGVAAVAGAIMIEPFRFERIRVWLNPEKFADEGGFQVLQSLYSLGSGGLFGKGLGNGIQKLGYVPEAQNDMIFTVICEELGVIGGIAVILMFIFMIWRFMIVANNAPDLFGSMLVVGVMAHISIQTVMNIAVVTNSMPNTGVTLPFMSYGGSSILCLLIEIGIVLTVSKRIKFE
ncbi:MAG: putative peptidoglycan glycosyltransferase FtsW [Lachnospiraceae bacterium]|nr:putative peptidoglycan glycosyltransferase FtsW [Lachnospiraceae bacterium]